MFKNIFQFIIFLTPLMIFCQDKKMSKKEAIQEVSRLNNLLNQANIDNEDLSKTIELKNNELQIKNNEFDTLFFKNKNLELELSKLLNDLQIEKDLVIKNKENLNLFEDSAKSLSSKITDIKNEIFSKKEVIDEQEKNINNLKEEINNYISKISQDSIKSKSQEDEINIKINKIKELNLNLDSIINLLNKKNKRINNLKDSLILSVKQKKKKSLSVRKMDLNDFDLSIISLKKIEDDWYFLNDNSAKNFVKYYSPENRNDYLDFHNLEYHYSKYDTQYPDSYDHRKFYKFKNISDYENSIGTLFTGVCYAYSRTYFFDDMLEDGSIDQGKIFKRAKKESGEEIIVYKVKNGLPIEILKYESECDWNKKYDKNVCFYYLSEHVYLDKIIDEDINQSFVLMNKILKYQIVSRYSSKNKEYRYKYFKKKESNFKVVIDNWSEEFGHTHKHKRYESVLNGLVRNWRELSSNKNILKGYYLSSEENYKNGMKHGYSREWKSFYERVNDKSYFNSPRLVFEGNYFEDKKVGKHFNWNYQGRDVKYRKYDRDYIKEYGKASQIDSIIYLSSVKNYQLFKNSKDNNTYSSLQVGLQYSIDSYSYSIDQKYFKIDLYDHKTHSYYNNYFNSSDEEIVVWKEWGKKFNADKKKISNEELWGWHNNSHTLIEEKEYWENGVLKTKTNYPNSYDQFEKNCYNRKKQRIQCN
ncbi:MAG: hypothetical protein CMP68_00055 [Flavobacteriales bacterium]|nr:hypothetical protein [Flavobacteriales bacterium]